MPCEGVLGSQSLLIPTLTFRTRHLYITRESRYIINRSRRARGRVRHHDSPLPLLPQRSESDATVTRVNERQLAGLRTHPGNRYSVLDPSRSSGTEKRTANQTQAANRRWAYQAINRFESRSPQSQGSSALPPVP